MRNRVEAGVSVCIAVSGNFVFELQSFVNRPGEADFQMFTAFMRQLFCWNNLLMRYISFFLFFKAWEDLVACSQKMFSILKPNLNCMYSMCVMENVPRPGQSLKIPGVDTYLVLISVACFKLKHPTAEYLPSLFIQGGSSAWRWLKDLLGS